MKSSIALKILITAVFFIPLSSLADTLEGKINGISCAIAGVVCPIDKLDPLVALEKDFVLQQPDGSFYLMPNVDRAVKARLVLDDVVVTGTVNERYKSIEVDEIQTRRGGAMKVVWSEAIQEDLRGELFGAPYNPLFNPGSN